jgi:hypothetical protein
VLSVVPPKEIFSVLVPELNEALPGVTDIVITTVPVFDIVQESRLIIPAPDRSIVKVDAVLPKDIAAVPALNVPPPVVSNFNVRATLFPILIPPEAVTVLPAVGDIVTGTFQPDEPPKPTIDPDTITNSVVDPTAAPKTMVVLDGVNSVSIKTLFVLNSVALNVKELKYQSVFRVCTDAAIAVYDPALIAPVPLGVKFPVAPLASRPEHLKSETSTGTTAPATPEKVILFQTRELVSKLTRPAVVDKPVVNVLPEVVTPPDVYFKVAAMVNGVQLTDPLTIAVPTPESNVRLVRMACEPVQVAPFKTTVESPESIAFAVSVPSLTVRERLDPDNVEATLIVKLLVVKLDERVFVVPPVVIKESSPPQDPPLPEVNVTAPSVANALTPETVTAVVPSVIVPLAATLIALVMVMVPP